MVDFLPDCGRFAIPQNREHFLPPHRLFEPIQKHLSQLTSCCLHTTLVHYHARCSEGVNW